MSLHPKLAGNKDDFPLSTKSPRKEGGKVKPVQQTKNPKYNRILKQKCPTLLVIWE